MPIYVYQVILPEDEDPEDAQTFEVLQKVDDPPLTHHPVNGMPVRRVIQSPSLPKEHTEPQERKRLDPANLAKKGFGKFEKAGDGTYVRTAGVGPDTIQHGPQPKK